MARQRQRCCVAVGAVLIMITGVVILAGWLAWRQSVVLQMFANQVSTALLLAGIAILLIGVLGTAVACSGGTCALFTYAWAAVLLSALCTVVGSLLSMQTSSDATHIESICIDVQTGANATSLVASPQRDYDALQEALKWCRAYTPLALRLDTCAKATDRQGRSWSSIPYVGVFRWAESQYSCSGFCKDAMPVFALPQGTVNQDNRGNLRPACYAQITEEMRARSVLASAVLLLGAAILLLPSCCACWLACAPPPLRRRDYVHRPEELEWTAISQDEGNSDEEQELTGKDTGSDHGSEESRKHLLS